MEGHSAPDAQTEMLLSLLTPYLNTWDKNAAKEATEVELVKLFDESTLLDKSEISSGISSSPTRQNDTAAEAMLTYIEMASSEKGSLV